MYLTLIQKGQILHESTCQRNWKGEFFFGNLFLIGFSGHLYLGDQDDVREWERQLANLDFLVNKISVT